MDGEAITAGGQRAEELRYVTEHFRDLQGLRSVPVWCCVLALPIVIFAHTSERTITGFLLGSGLASSIGFLWIGRWYRSRYGLVRRPVETEARSPVQIWVVLGVAGFALVAFLSSHGTAAQGAALLLLGYSVILIPRCFDPGPWNGIVLLRRTLYCAALLMLVALTLALFHWQPGRWLLTDCFGGSSLLLGLYDHWLLDSVLRQGGLQAEAPGE